MSQKDQLLRELDSVKEQLNIDQPDQKKKVVLNVSNNAGDSTRRHKQELKVKVIIMFLCLRSCVFLTHIIAKFFQINSH